MVDPALQELAEERLGSPEMAARVKRLVETGQKVPPEAKALARRVAKIFLPQGKRLPKDDAAAREEFASRQIDLEQAIAAAGGQCGGMRG